MVTCAEMRSLEAAAVAGGATEDSLMEEAGAGLAATVMALVPPPAAVIIVAGKGHNAGDAWVAARHWLDAGWTIVGAPAFAPEEWRPLTRAKWDKVASRLGTMTPASGRLVVIDALLGLGSGPGLRAPVVDACRRINDWRRTRHATVVAVDGPSGLDFDTGDADPDAVQADLTVTVAVAKRGLLAEAALDHVGRLSVVPVTALQPSPATRTVDRDEVLTPARLRSMTPGPRPFNFHKGQAGRVLVVAGSRGMLGAARLAAAAAVHGGAGLVTLAVPKSLQDVAAASICPEVMVLGYRDPAELANHPADALAVGPGLGRRTDEVAMAEWLAHDPRPGVVDADALNALAAAGKSETTQNAGSARAALARPDRLLTPHPGEMRRLLETWDHAHLDSPRSDQARGLAATLGSTVLLKGSRTVIATNGHPLAHTPTGHPGMASGGFGDVLTGLSAALLAQSLPPHTAACLGSWLLGRAAELALFPGPACPESLRASLALNHLGQAFLALRYSEA